MKFIVLALAFIGAASAGFIAPLSTYWNSGYGLGYGYGAGYYGLGATAYAAPAYTAYAAPALTAYAAPAITHYSAPLTTVTGYVAPTYGFDLWKKKKA